MVEILGGHSTTSSNSARLVKGPAVSNVFSLDTLREDVEKKFAPVTITLSDGEEIVLRNIMRLSKDDRKAVLAVIEEIQAEGDDSQADSIESTLAGIAKLFGIIAQTKAKGAKLVKEIGDNLPLTTAVFSAWMKESQLGEAGNSPT